MTRLIRLVSFVLLAAWVEQPQQAFSCSAFSPKDSSFLAANYDWQVEGAMILSNESGRRKTAFVLPSQTLEQPVTWTSRYASITTTQWGLEFPVQGINSEGLAGVLLNGPADWAPRGGLGVISEQQWLQYQLDRYRTIDEISNHLNDLGVAPISGRLHYFFCDHTAECAWVEFRAGRAVMEKSRDIPTARAITNSSFAESQERWQRFLADGGSAASLPRTYNSLDRFVRATWFSLDSYEHSQSLFDRLTFLAGFGLTQWGSVFDVSVGKVWVRAFGSKDSEILDLKNSDILSHCRDRSKPRMKQLYGNRFGAWQAYSEKEALNLLKRAAKPAQGYSDTIIEAMIAYPNSFECESLGQNEVL